jgi:hypothetical protein
MIQVLRRLYGDLSFRTLPKLYGKLSIRGVQTGVFGSDMKKEYINDCLNPPRYCQSTQLAEILG